MVQPNGPQRFLHDLQTFLSAQIHKGPSGGTHHLLSRRSRFSVNHGSIRIEKSGNHGKIPELNEGVHRKIIQLTQLGKSMKIPQVSAIFVEEKKKASHQRCRIWRSISSRRDMSNHWSTSENMCRKKWQIKGGGEKIGINKQLPSGKRLHDYGESPFFIGKLTISMAVFQ